MEREGEKEIDVHRHVSAQACIYTHTHPFL